MSEDVERRVSEVEMRLARLEQAVAEAVEEARRAIGRLDRAAEYCRKMSARLEEMEAWRERQDGTVRQVTSSMRLAGGAFMAVPRRGASSTRS